jgi:hypothetical protein
VKAATNTTVPGGIVLQLLINKLYQTPVAVNCQLGVQTHWVTVANITSPKLFTLADPNITNPDITNSTPNEASVSLAPGETAYITLRVVNPTPALTPFNPLTAITPVTVPQAVNTTTVLSNPGNTGLTAPAIYPPVSILTTSLPATDVNNPGYSVPLQAAGGRPGPDTFSLASGPLPNGITLTSSGLLNGQPTQVGSFPVTIKATDGALNSGTMNFTLVVNAPFLITSGQGMPDGIAGVFYSTIPYTTTGGTPPYTWSATNLPPGLSINRNTGLVSGTPTTVGAFNAAITETDSALPPRSLSPAKPIRIAAALALVPVPGALTAGNIGAPYTFQFGTTGGLGSISFNSSGLPAGATLNNGGLLSFPAPNVSSISFMVSATDQSNPLQQQVSGTYSINFAGPVGGHVIFVTQPPNYRGGQPSPNSPVHVQVVDNSNAPIANASVTMSLPGTPPCSTAVLSGTLTQSTNATGDVFFTDLSVDRGQIGYALRATVSSVFGVSNPFTVNGFCGAGNLSVARDLPTATRLQNSMVLVAGGQASGSAATNAADLYNPATGAFTSISGTNTGRFGHTATLLNDGTVLIVGGQINSTYLSSAEIYNPGTTTFTTLANGLNTARASHTATLLTDGSVLIAGGFNGDFLNSAEIYNPTSQAFTTVGPLHSFRSGHTATLLPNGKVLVASGLDATAELYDPIAKTFSTTGSLNTARQSPSATLLSNGKVLIAGGLVNGATGIGTAELYDPVAGTFSFGGSLNNARGAHTATLLPDGTVLVEGGFNCPPPSCSNPIQGTAEIYDPSSLIFTNTGSLISARWEDTATLLNDGSVLIAGGFSGNSPTATAERYYSTAPLAAMQVTTPTSLANGQPSTAVFSNPTAFNGAASNISAVGFNGILPAGTPFQGFNPLVVSGVSFSTSNPGTAVNVTTSTFYAPKNYPADFIIDSSNPGPNNQLTITLPQPTRALGIDYGGFAGGASGSLTLANGFVLPLSNLPAAGQTQFSGFVSATPFSSLTLNITNDSWVVLDLLLAAANTALPSATESVPYTQVLLEQGGVGPLTWTLASGALPPGLSLTPSGILTGSPTASGAFTFAVHLVDSSSPQKGVTSGSFTINVLPQPATNLIASPQGTGIVTLTWTPSTSGDVAGYNVRRGTSSGVYTTVINAGTGPQYVDTGLTSGQTYFYVVSAVSTSGVESVFSNEATVVVP